MAWVYILQGSAGRHYVGSTLYLERRLEEHGRGHTQTTRRLGELTLVAAKAVGTLNEARQIERWLKAKKSPQLAIFHLEQLCAAPESFRVSRKSNSPLAHSGRALAFCGLWWGETLSSIGPANGRTEQDVIRRLDGV